MKTLSSKLFGGLAAAALVVGSFSMTSVNAEVSMDDVTVEATQDLAQTTMAAEWILTRNFFVIGNPTSTAE